MDNLELFHRHSRNMLKSLEEQANKNDRTVGAKPSTGYEPVQAVSGSCHGVHFIPLDTTSFDLDVIQRLQHGTTVIHYDPDSGRSVLCLMRLDSSCGAISWRKISYSTAKDPKEKDSVLSKPAMIPTAPSVQESAKGGAAQPATSNKAQGTTGSTLEEGELKLTMVKQVEPVDSYDLDIEVLLLVVRSLQKLQKYPDRRMMWIKNLYLQLYKESSPEPNGERMVGPRPYDALQAFGGRVERWKGFGLSQASASPSRPNDSSLSSEPGGTKNRLKNFKNAMQKKLRGASREGSRSQSPQPPSPLVNSFASSNVKNYSTGFEQVRPPSIKSQMSSQSGPPGPNSPGYLLKPRADTAASDCGDLDSLYTPRSRTPTSSSYGGEFFSTSTA
ncbi:unnamed protein product [Heligmosomoides polygyrus]|uniref:Uncharacterized protein n=1 Tax=Heligmosomoides polygyrus TaxID=6339 RepID=A0A3P7ZJS0_HELPZ|nr:unnamed protein product [Heligmosomoides polygyrus]